MIVSRSILDSHKHHMQTLERAIAFVLLLCFVAITFLAPLLLLAHADHDCVGTDCHVCVETNSVKSLMKQIGRAVVHVLCAGAILLTFAILARLSVAKLYIATPYGCKVRLNN